MAGRSDTTVIIRTQGLLLRADIGGRGDAHVQQWRRDWSDIAPAVAHALSEGGKPGRQVWVLDSEVWLGVVDLPAGAVAGQSDKALEGPAAYEAEALSDLSPTEAVTSVQRRRHVEHGDQFLVVQARRAEVAAVAKAIRAAGSRLAGLGHPAGLPEAMHLEPNTGSVKAWRRVEFWYESIVLVESFGGNIGLFPLGMGPRSDWRRALTPLMRAGDAAEDDQTLLGPGVRVRGGTQWRESTAVEGTARWLAAGEDHADEDDGVPIWDLSDDATAQQFAEAWARKLLEVHPGSNTLIPTLRPPKAPASRWPAILVGTLALALAVFAVVAQREEASHRVAELQEQVDAETEDRKVLDEAKKQERQLKTDLRGKQKTVAGLEAERQKLIQQQMLAQRSEDSIVDRRPALSAMLESLTSSNNETIMIQSIEHGSPTHKILGMATSPEAATRLAREISGKLRGLWIVSPPQIGPETGAAQVVWRFTITVEPAAVWEARR